MTLLASGRVLRGSFWWRKRLRCGRKMPRMGLDGLTCEFGEYYHPTEGLRMAAVCGLPTRGFVEATYWRSPILREAWGRVVQAACDRCLDLRTRVPKPSDAFMTYRVVSFDDWVVFKVMDS